MEKGKIVRCEASCDVVDAAEIRIRAERRLGEMIHQQKETVGLNRGQLLRGTRKEPREDSPPTLAEAGIDKELSARGGRWK